MDSINRSVSLVCFVHGSLLKHSFVLPCTWLGCDFGLELGRVTGGDPQLVKNRKKVLDILFYYSYSYYSLFYYSIILLSL